MSAVRLDPFQRIVGVGWGQGHTGRLFLGGGFTTFNGAAAAHHAIFDPDLGWAYPASSGGSTVIDAAVYHGHLYTLNAAGPHILRRYNAASDTWTSFPIPGLATTQRALLVHDDLLWLGGDAGGVGNSLLASFDGATFTRHAGISGFNLSVYGLAAADAGIVMMCGSRLALFDGVNSTALPNSQLGVGLSADTVGLRKGFAIGNVVTVSHDSPQVSPPTIDGTVDGNRATPVVVYDIDAATMRGFFPHTATVQGYGLDFQCTVCVPGYVGGRFDGLLNPPAARVDGSVNGLQEIATLDSPTGHSALAMGLTLTGTAFATNRIYAIYDDGDRVHVGGENLIGAVGGVTGSNNFYTWDKAAGAWTRFDATTGTGSAANRIGVIIPIDEDLI